MSKKLSPKALAALMLLGTFVVMLAVGVLFDSETEARRQMDRELEEWRLQEWLDQVRDARRVEFERISL